jgi:phosphatidylglycerophosphate synthase
MRYLTKRFDVSACPAHTCAVLAGNRLIVPQSISARETASRCMPAFVVASPETKSLRVAALTLLDRLVVTLHRAGAAPIIIQTKEPLPELRRSRALGIAYKTCSDFPNAERPVLLATSNLLVQPADARRCIETHSRLHSTDGEPLPFGVIDAFAPRAEAALSEASPVRANGLALKVTDRVSASAAERALWRSLTSSSDGLVDKFFNRPCGRPLAKLLIHTAVSPNMISIASIMIGVVSALYFAGGTYQSIIIGALLLQLSAIIDCIDGDVARVVFKETPLGKWIDLAGDQIVHVAVFAGLAVGVAKSAGTPELLWLGVSAVAGAILSFAVVLRGMRKSSRPNSLLKRLIDGATNRDFSVLVLMLSAFDLTEIFLWLAATGSHLFWIAALSLQVSRSPQDTSDSG